MTWLSDLVERTHGGPVERYRAEMEPFERSVLRAARGRLLDGLQGRVLELGCGLGESFPFYPASAHVIAIEPFPQFRAQAQREAARLGGHIAVQDGDAHDLKFPDRSFDGLMTSLVFCSLSDPGKGLSESKRVLKPGAAARFLEHVRADRRPRAWLQKALNPPWELFDGSGCRLDRQTPRSIVEAGFEIQRIDEIPVPHVLGVLFPLVEIYARA
jgi:SAM-dependent methyltransferase